MAASRSFALTSKLYLLSSLAFILFSYLLQTAHGSKTVQVQLRSKWTGTPLFFEAGEFISEESNELFWKFLEVLDGPELGQKNKTEAECVSAFLTHGKQLIGGALSALLDLSIAARTLSPAVVLHRQLAIDSLTKGASTLPKDAGKGPWEMNSNPNAPNGQCCWVDIGGRILLEASAVKKVVSAPFSGNEEKRSKVHTFDHIHPSSPRHGYPVVLYAAPGTKCFQTLHAILVEASEKELIRYIYRPVLPNGCEAAVHRCVSVGHGGPVNLAGYGVEMALKNMEYKAIDDSAVKKDSALHESREEDLSQDVKGFKFSTLIERRPELKASLLQFREHLLLTNEEGFRDTYTVWELKDLGIQAAQRIVQSSQPFAELQEISQNFPNLVTSLSRVKASRAIVEEQQVLHRKIQSGRSMLTLNGVLLNTEGLDLFSLLKKVQTEVKLAERLQSLKLPASCIQQLTKLPPPDAESAVRLDFRSDSHVFYLNNIEKDSIYRSWRSNLNELLMPSFPGQLRTVRKNLFYAVYVLDLAQPITYRAVEEMGNFFRNQLPLTLGVMLAAPSHISSFVNSLDPPAPADWLPGDLTDLAMRMFAHIQWTQSSLSAFEFLESVGRQVVDPSMNQFYGGFEVEEDVSSARPITEGALVEAFLESVGSSQHQGLETIDSLKKAGAPEAAMALDMSRHVYSLGLGTSVPCLLFNGIVHSGRKFLNVALEAMNVAFRDVQRAIYYQQINSRSDVLSFFMQEGSVGRYNPEVLGNDGHGIRYTGMARLIQSASCLPCSFPYLHHPGSEDEFKHFSHWLAVDLTAGMGLTVVLQALKHLSSSGRDSRIALLPNSVFDLPDSLSLGSYLLPRIVFEIGNASSRRSKLVPFLLAFLSSEEAVNILTPHVDDSTALRIIQSAVNQAKEHGLNVVGLEGKLTDVSSLKSFLSHLSKAGSQVTAEFGIKPASNAIITNGRVLELSNTFLSEDFTLLEVFEKQRTLATKEVILGAPWDTVSDIEADDLSSDFLSTVMMAASSEILSRNREGNFVDLGPLFEDIKESAIIRHNKDALFVVEGVIDPLSPGAQLIAPFLVLLHEWLSPSFRIILSPQLSLSEVPLKNFYRFAHPVKEGFGRPGSGPQVTFSRLPESRTLTMNLMVPEPWLVESTVAVYDLDNLVLEKVQEKTVHAVFELEALMITGHCHDNSEPPRGLQLVLGTPSQPKVVDTLVMANLGYFQLKASPGVWTLGLAPGRSTDLYTLRDGSLEREVVLRNLGGLLVTLDVSKRPGMESEELLVTPKGSEFGELEGEEQERKSSSIWGNVVNVLKGVKSSGGGQVQPGAKDDVINIFSIASGHLYERFTKIMILSVIKNTRRPVKFWFIKNYLSPRFKDVIPVMAAHYGFQYELVTYKWPSWLHKQTEKQRLIWAYKILFLDVLFPLSTRRVIFVDADQVVRADMGELYDMNLRGAPLAYTPMCDNNVDMEGYRFWKQGFWRDHLGGRPYHISALYVVDLLQFRALAAGDQLRVIYESLSKDPNSLANLDQDLPNYAQHQVPIFSLPQHWLWCESWCGNATKSKAKTIDLCNNPMTKEPKLQGARRIVSEWSALDDEQRAFTEKVESGEIDLDAGHHGSTKENPPAPTREDEAEAREAIDAQEEAVLADDETKDEF